MHCISMLISTFFIVKIRSDQEGLFKLVTLDRILNRITGVTSGCWWLVAVNTIPLSDIILSNKPTKHIQLQCYK
jgi:MFS-type transporter involved in bile tolerance (Atg22 family)